MKKSISQIFLAMAMAAAKNNDVYYTKDGNRITKKIDRSYYKDKDSRRQLREFTINGNKILAYSRKDAIIRLKHSK